MHSANSSQRLASLALRQLLLSHRGAGHQGRAHCPAGLSWANGSILWSSRMEGKKEGEEERALSTALGLYFCAAPMCVCVCRTHSALARCAHPPIRQFMCRGDAKKGEERCLLLRLETELERLHIVPTPESQPRHCGHCAHTATRALMCSFTFLDASSPQRC